MSVNTSLARIEERLNNWMTTTEDYRLSLCQKMSDLRNDVKALSDKVALLPCDRREEASKGKAMTIKLLWGSVGIVFGLLVAHMGWK